MDAVSAEATLTRLLGARLTDCVRIGGGRNSQVYRAQTADGAAYAAKFYFRPERLENEFRALDFLFRNQKPILRATPRPVVCSPMDSCALYEFIDGLAPDPSAISEEDVDACATFLRNLQHVRKCPGADSLPPAAEACFSLPSLLDNLHRRASALETVAAENPGLAKFLRERWHPALDFFKRRSRNANLEEPLDPKLRILSPSDFGFHNALRRNGLWVFLDFEFFGWDDPAKTVSDFLLHPHPDMKISVELRARFQRAILSSFDSSLEERIIQLFPLYALKWCLILLNEFLADHFRRREFAEGAPLDRESVTTRQLKAAEEMLARAENIERY